MKMKVRGGSIKERRKRKRDKEGERGGGGGGERIRGVRDERKEK